MVVVVVMIVLALELLGGSSVVEVDVAEADEEAAIALDPQFFPPIFMAARLRSLSSSVSSDGLITGCARMAAAPLAVPVCKEVSIAGC